MGFDNRRDIVKEGGYSKRGGLEGDIVKEIQKVYRILFLAQAI